MKLYKLINQHPTLFEAVTNRKKTGQPAAKKPKVCETQALPKPHPNVIFCLQFNAMGRPTESATPSGRPLTANDLAVPLKNRPAEVRSGADMCKALLRRACSNYKTLDAMQLFWPDDALWYLVEVQSFNPKTRQAK
jgi:hypothetical protein